MAHHPLARHLIAQIERRTRRNSSGVLVLDRIPMGHIHFQELIDAIMIMERGTGDEKLEWLFDLNDLDGNGEIDKLEMMEIIKVSL